MEHPKAIGDRSQLAVMVALRDLGLGVYLPFGENTRSDLIIEDGVGLSRVQCKTGRLRRGAIRFAVCSCYGHHRNPGESRRTYAGQVEFFAIYCPETEGVYLVPIDDVPLKSEAALRVEPSRKPSKAQHPTSRRLRDRKSRRKRYCSTCRPAWCCWILRLTRCRALSIVFVSTPSRSAISS
jgi:PD-(D/E)XK endonuclease